MVRVQLLLTEAAICPPVLLTCSSPSRSLCSAYTVSSPSLQTLTALRCFAWLLKAVVSVIIKVKSQDNWARSFSEAGQQGS